MRVALVSTEVRGVHVGGIGAYVVEAASALAAAGHEVWLVTYQPEGVARGVFERLPGFARVVFVEDCPSAASPVRFGLAREPLRFAQFAHERLRDAGVAFDYIEFADYGAAGAVAVAEQNLFDSHGNAVLAVALHSPTYECWHFNELMHVYGPTQRETAALEHETIRTAPVLWSPSANLRDRVCRRLQLDPASVAQIHYPRQAPAGAPTPPRPKSDLRELKFLFVGRIEPRKGVRELAAAFAQLPELAIECVGRDSDTAPQRTSEIEYLRRITDNLNFTGELTAEQVHQKVVDADVVVLPSRWDNWPNACLEAMAAARVVIAGDNSGMAEMITSGQDGFLCRSGDANDLVRVIREDLRAALPALDRIGLAAAERSRQLSSPSAYVARIEQLVAQVRARPRRAAAPRSGDLVSVVVPYYREDLELVDEALASAERQTHQNVEILLVNDGSPRADADEILGECARRHPRVRVLHKANGGVASARNHAIEHARGDYVLCLDADNRLRPEYAATGVEVFARVPDAVAVVPRFEVFNDVSGQVLVHVQALPYDRPLALFRNSLGDGGAMFRRAVFREHGLRYDPDVDCYSDWALWLDLAGRGLRVQVVPRVLYDYRVRADSMMAEQAWQRHLTLLGLLIQRHLPDGDERELLIALTQGWGVGALLAALGSEHSDWEEPQATAARLRQVPSAANLFEQAFTRLGSRMPWIAAIGRGLVRAAANVHGRFKA